MQTALAKRRAGQELNGSENRLFEEYHRLHDLKFKERVLFDQDSQSVKFVKSMEVDPVFEGVKILSEGNSDRLKTGLTYLGSIDPITAANWSRECGAAIGTREFAEYAKKKLMSGDFAHFRADSQKVLF